MKTRVVVALCTAGLMLAACGAREGDRAVSGGLIGGGIGILGGPPGVVLGAAVGTAAGAVTEADDFDLGKPVWRD